MARRNVDAAVGGISSPAGLSGLNLWVRGDLGVTKTTTISAWADQSGAGHNGSQATGAKQPTFVANDINANPGASFNGSNGMPFGVFQVGTTAMTVFAVVNAAAYGSNAILAKAFAGTDWELTGDGAGGVYWAVSSGGGTRANTNGSVTGAAHVFIGTYDSALGTNTTLLYVDGVLQTTKGTFAGPIPFGADNVAMGAYSGAVDTEAANLTGNIDEGGTYSRALGAAEVAQLNAYLKTRYNTP